MKKLLSIFVMVLCVLSISAQQKVVTKFLGIPVDGTKAEMRKKLIAKGFTPKTVEGTEFFEGEFNGHDVRVYIVTNNNKVWRIMLCDKTTCGETDIKIRFNNLCRQFDKNERYVIGKLDGTDYIIPEKEDISYEMLVHNKRYEASYYQVLDKATIEAITVPESTVRGMLKDFGGIENPTEEQMKNAEDLGKASLAFDMTRKKSVWFMISESYGNYSITMYYDNEYNHSDGEDL